MGLTYHRPDGNRVVADDTAALPRDAARQDEVDSATPDDPSLGMREIALGEPANWLAAAPTREGAVWVAALASGRRKAFKITSGRISEIPIPGESLDPATPLHFLLRDASVVVAAPKEGESPFTHPLLSFAGGGVTGSSERVERAAIRTDGSVVLEKTGVIDSPGSVTAAVLDARALPDARILRDERGRLLLLTDPSTAYRHGVLGDGLEAGSITLMETEPSPALVRRIKIPRGDVIEGTAPIWTDLDGDGGREIIVTLSNHREGARLAVFGENGKLLAESDPIGRGFRWRHQIAAAPFGPSGEMELAAVLTPHIGGTVEYFRWRGKKLERMAGVYGYSSHSIGSRNLDMGVAGDFDGDGGWELLIPTQDQRALAILRRNHGGVEQENQLPLGSRLSSNLAAVVLADGGVAVGAAAADGTLRIWHFR